MAGVVILNLALNLFQYGFRISYDETLKSLYPELNSGPGSRGPIGQKSLLNAESSPPPFSQNKFYSIV